MLDQPGFDGRHRDPAGRIGAKHARTRISILRKIYGRSFAEGAPDTATLKDVLHKLHISSLSKLYSHVDDGSLDGKIKAAEAAADRSEPAG